jgi:pimeloyl-ACP methyl ester carboxylesterase
MKVYFISGLGADGRIFHHVQLPVGYEAVFMEWIQPLANESLHDYALRMAENIDTTEPFVLAGLSLGGMLATEIARKYPPQLLILISSIPCSGHLPVYYRAAGKFGLHKLVPVSLLKSASFIKRFFTAEKNEDKLLIRRLIRETDPAFIRWALNAIVKWKCDAYTGQIIHIHGKSDAILPVRFTKPTHVISRAGHMMVLTKAAEINLILKGLLVY